MTDQLDGISKYAGDGDGTSYVWILVTGHCHWYFPVFISDNHNNINFNSIELSSTNLMRQDDGWELVEELNVAAWIS